MTALIYNHLQLKVLFPWVSGEVYPSKSNQIRPNQTCEKKFNHGLTQMNTDENEGEIRKSAPHLCPYVHPWINQIKLKAGQIQVNQTESNQNQGESDQIKPNQTSQNPSRVCPARLRLDFFHELMQIFFVCLPRH